MYGCSCRELDATVFFFCSISRLVDESIYDEAMDLVYRTIKEGMAAGAKALIFGDDMNVELRRDVRGQRVGGRRGYVQHRWVWGIGTWLQRWRGRHYASRKEITTGRCAVRGVLSFTLIFAHGRDGPKWVKSKQIDHIMETRRLNRGMSNVHKERRYLTIGLWSSKIP